MKKKFKHIHFFSLLLLLLLAYINYHYKIYVVNSNSQGVDYDFKIMTYNLNAYDRSLNEEESNELLYIIKKEAPDILCIQELSKDNFLALADALDSIFGYDETNEVANDELRYAIYSKRPIRNFTRYACNGDIDTTCFNVDNHKALSQLRLQMPLTSAEIEVIPNFWVTVLSCHLYSSAYTTARREIGNDANWFEGLPLYYRNYMVGKQIRDFEADNASRFIKELRNCNKSIIFVGDFNDWTGSYCMKKIQGGTLDDVWCKKGSGFGFTYHGWHMRLRLDHILYSHELAPVDVSVKKYDFSDHWPLIGHFKIKYIENNE